MRLRSRYYLVSLGSLTLAPSCQTRTQTHLGQHAAAVSPLSIEYSIPQPDLPPAVASAAVVYPMGHAMPGEYSPHPIMTPGCKSRLLALGGQQSVKSRAATSGLQVWAIHTVVHVSHTAIAYEQTPGGVHVVVSGPSSVRGEVMMPLRPPVAIPEV